MTELSTIISIQEKTIQQLRAENAVLVEALKETIEDSHINPRHLDEKCECSTHRALKNTSEQAKTLLAVVDAALSVIKHLSKSTAVEMNAAEYFAYQKLGAALAAYDKLREGEK